MKFNAEKLKQISRPMTDVEREEIEYREENRDWLAMSADFALSLRQILRTEHITQTELASRMGVSCAQVTKILSGKENLGLQTIAKVEKAIGRRIIHFGDEMDIDIETPSELIYSDNEAPVPTLCAEQDAQYGTDSRRNH